VVLGADQKCVRNPMFGLTSKNNSFDRRRRIFGGR